MNLKNSFLSFYLVLVSFPIMPSNIIVPNEEILEKPFPLPYERINLSKDDLRNFIDKTINNKKIKKTGQRVVVGFFPRKCLNIKYEAVI